MTFRLPPIEELRAAGRQERMNMYRRYFASSRYNRLLIQQMLVKSANKEDLISRVESMEHEHNRNYVDTVGIIKEQGYLQEFLEAVNEEDQALQKIIEAYNKRMQPN